MSPNQKEELLRREGKVAFRPLPPEINLDDVFCLVERKMLRKDNSFMVAGRLYHLPPRKQVVYKAQEKVDLHTHPGKKIRVFYKEKFVEELPWIN